MKKTSILAAVSLIGLTASAQALEGHWPWGQIQGILSRKGYVRTISNCRATRSMVAEHCTIDFQNEDGVRISVAVRSTFDNRPDYAYRVICTASCNKFYW
jgi:hypothetical protein